jgi:hypothetical protein
MRLVALLVAAAGGVIAYQFWLKPLIDGDTAGSGGPFPYPDETAATDYRREVITLVLNGVAPSAAPALFEGRYPYRLTTSTTGQLVQVRFPSDVDDQISGVRVEGGEWTTLPLPQDLRGRFEYTYRPCSWTERLLGICPTSGRVPTGIVITAPPSTPPPSDGDASAYTYGEVGPIGEPTPILTA